MHIAFLSNFLSFSPASVFRVDCRFFSINLSFVVN